jgi:enamidase
LSWPGRGEPLEMEVLIHGIGSILTGEFSSPRIEGDAVLIRDGLIAAAGPLEEIGPAAAGTVIDACGATLAPGLIDSHVHPTFGDWTPRQAALGWVESALHGGVTTMVSAGEVHLPGRARDVTGIKATAIAVQRAYANFRPGGVKMIAGAPVPELEMTGRDFEELAAAGIRLVGEIGLGSVRDAAAAAKVVQWARAHGLVSTMHTGGPSVAGSSAIDADTVLAADPDIVGHVNGGTTALPLDQVRCLCRECGGAIEIVHNGNPLAALTALRTAREAGRLDRVILGTDSPSGSGTQPLGMLRLLALLCSLGQLPAEEAVCLATGNTARIHRLDRGRVRPGLAADLLLLDAPEGSAAATASEALELGDIPGVGMVMVDGEILVKRSRNTAPARRHPNVITSA